MKKILLLVALTLFAVNINVTAQGLKSFTLKNGMKVYIWEDNTQSDVYGAVCVRTGSVNDPAEYTGLAHYLEHMMFKGTDKISTLDWDAEKPVYEQIIAKYDEMADETDPVKKEAIGKEINALTIKESQLSVSTEFSNLMEGMGGKALNAGTSYDLTYYHNSFPAYQINKWLEISSQRFINPVFRAFQPELETVYEEYNRSKDNSSDMQNEFLFSKIFEGHPYSRPVIGLGEHLKNPRLSKLTKYYNDWYTPGNMALIIVGNIKAEDISGRINATFGHLKAKATPERKTYPDLEIKGKTTYSKKIGDYPTVYLTYKGVKSGDPDEIPLLIVMNLLSNSSETGLIDRLTIDGDLMLGAAAPITFREQGRNIIIGVPLYDKNQRRFESNKTTEKKLLAAVNKISKGEFEDWLVESVKKNLCRDYDLDMESNYGKLDKIMNAFVADMNMNSVLNYKDEIMAVTTDKIKEVAKKYLNDNYIAIYTEKGKTPKNEKIKKPKYDPIEKPEGKQSIYAMQFKNMPIGKVESKIFKFDEVQSKKLNNRSTLYYTNNPENNIYSLAIRYGAGKRVFPKIGVAASLMNSAGIMGSMESNELKEALSKLNTTCSVSANDDYLTITMYGYENTLVEACQLLTRQILMPKLDDKQLDRLKSSIIVGRINQMENVQSLSDALEKYVIYKDKSDYIDNLTDQEVADMQIAELTGDINRAANYEAEIYYTGTMPFDDVYSILSQNLPLVANEQASDSPKDKELSKVEENTVYFLPNSDAEQAQLYFYTPTENYDKKDQLLYDAFYQYFAGGFNGLVIQEIREKRSMAYSADAGIIRPTLAGSPCFFYGTIGTQNDKAIDAITVFMDLVRNMPKNDYRIENIKNYLREEYMTTKPSFRAKGIYMEKIKRRGFTSDVADEILPQIDSLTFEDIVNFYKKNIKDKPIVIGVMGNPKNISKKDLEKFGKVIRINEKKLFNDKDKLF